MIKKLKLFSRPNSSEKYTVDRVTSQELTGYASVDRPWLKYYDKKAIESPLPECTAYEYMVESNKDNLYTTAIEYYGTKLSFKSFEAKIDKVAKAFYKLGVRQGDVVTFMSVANPELEIAFYALNKLGAIVNLIDVRSDSKAIKSYLTELKSKFMFALDNFLPEINKCIEETSVERVITVSPFNSVLFPFSIKAEADARRKDKELYENIDIVKRGRKFISWNDFFKDSKIGYEIDYPKYVKDTPAVYVHTGGTTGVSKTVVLSNDNMNALAFQYALLNTGYNKGDTFLNDIVPFVAYGIVAAIHMPKCLGLTSIIAPILSPQEFTEFMIKYKPNHTITVPSYLDDYFKDSRVEKMNLSHHKHIGCGGDELSIEKEQIMNKFLSDHHSDAVIEKGYGMTELSSASVLCVRSVNKMLSLGIPLPKTVVSIFSHETGMELRYGEIGEIAIKSPAMMIGYLNNEEEENNVKKVHSDGSIWIHSGDLGHMDEDGFLFFDGRIKRMIIKGGFKIYPLLVEKLLNSSKYVDTCCVVGQDDKEFGSIPIAYIVLKPEYKNEEAKIKHELCTLCNLELSEYSVPCDFIFCDKLPLTSIGKVAYKKLEKKKD